MLSTKKKKTFIRKNGYTFIEGTINVVGKCMNSVKQKYLNSDLLKNFSIINS